MMLFPLIKPILKAFLYAVCVWYAAIQAFEYDPIFLLWVFLHTNGV